MKKMVLGLSLSLAALAFLLSPAMAAASPAPVLSAEDQEFIASLAAPAPELEAKRPGIGLKSACTATANCGTGSPVSCSGTSSCTAVDRNCAAGVRGNVTCDGVKTKCQPACPVDCDALANQCAETCGFCPITQFQCDPYICHCDFNPNCV
ncbi:MAG TPA: hypothetical protein VLV54_12080 [Thermoanaerobaculia bacterium]|nr:hypothetical protein [Thermoanaerobaculia bacterium]